MAKLHLKLNSNKARLSSLMLSAVGLFALGGQSASAQDTAGTPGYILVSHLADVVSVSINADGSLDLYLADGTKAVIPAEYVVQQEGEYYIETFVANDLSAFAATDSYTGLLIVAGGLAGIGAISALASSDDGPSNAAPVFSSATTQTYTENATITAYTAAASDTSGDPLTYSISGSDAALFNIDATTGAVTFRNSPDFEAPADAGTDNVYNITVTVSDGQLSATQDVAITVTNENDNAPLITSAATASIAENETDIGYSVAATDADGDALTYAIAGGADAALFVIDSATGELSFASGRDFEMPADGNTDNQYEVTVEVSDGTFTDSQAVTVTVTNTNDNAPLFTSGAAANVAENVTATGYTAVATDLDGDAISYSISGGADAALFTVDSSTGALSFSNAPDYDMPADANGDNVFNVTIRASDGTNATDQAVAVSITNVNDNSPIFTSSAVISFDENGTASPFSVVATDGDGDTLSYSISGGADSSLFTIDSSTGAVSFVNPPDFETPTDSGADNTYNIIVRADDGTFQSNQAVSITINNINDNGPVVTGGISNISENNTSTGFTATATDADGNVVTFSIAGGADAALFSVDASTGELSFVSAPDFDNPTDAGADNTYDVIIQGSDGTYSDTAAVAISVTNLNDEVPVFTSAASAAMGENLTVTGYNATATDGDGDTLSYSISGGTDAALFTINSSTGALSFITAPDYENPTDTGANNVYNVVVTASDGVNASTQAVAITVQDVAAEAPIFSSGATGTVVENSTATVYTAVAVDPNGNPVTYSISGGADAALFTINANTGAVQFTAGVDFENPIDAGADNVYDIEISAFDGTDTATQAVAITVTDVNDVAPSFSSSGTVTSAENSTATFYTPLVVDSDGGTLSYSIVGGADASFFTIDAATGALSFINAPDFETRIDANSDNEYLVTVEVSDGIFTAQQQVRATVTDVDEAPVFDVPSTVSVDENMVATLYSAPASDDDGDTITYSITGGVDAAAFTIDSNTGQLSFVNAPDFEAPTDTGADNVYDVTVTAASTTFTTDQNVAVTVNDVNEAPVIDANFLSLLNAIQEGPNGSTFNISQLFNDPENGTLTYSVGGPDAALFIASANGDVSPNPLLDFENPTDVGLDNILEITLTASDGVNTTTTNLITMNVINVRDENVVFTGSATANIAENLQVNPGQISSYYWEHTPAYTAIAMDPDQLASVTYSITGGADASLFRIESSTGEVRFLTSPDFEAPTDANTDNVYDIEITASDGNSTAVQSVGITVDDVTTTQFVSAPVSQVDENRLWQGTDAPVLDAVSDSGNPITYSIVGGADAGLVSIIARGADTFILRMTSNRDFENPGDANSDNVYEVIVQADDGVTTATQTILFSVLDTDDEAPTVTSAVTASVTENSTLAYTLAATDVDTDDSTLTYFIQGNGADNALFTIDRDTGELSFVSPPDFENPSDANMDNVYDVTLLASDGTQGTLHSVSITVTDVINAKPSAPADVFTELANDDGWDALNAIDIHDADVSLDGPWESNGFQQFIAESVDPAMFADLSEAVSLPYIGTQLNTDVSGVNDTALYDGGPSFSGLIDSPTDLPVTDDVGSATAFDFLQLYNVA